MCDNWFENMDNGNLTGVVFLDIRKAFDLIDHSILLENFEFYGDSERELTWFKPHLPDNNVS